MGANLRVVSEPGLGSSFSLHMSLPVIAGSLGSCADIDLEGVRVYVRAARNDIGQILADWLNHWASPRPGYAGSASSRLPCNPLLDLDPDQPPTVPWQR